MKTRFITLLVLFAFVVSDGIGQSSPSIDSLKAILPLAKDDSAKVDILLQVAGSYLASEPQNAISYAEEARDLSEKLGYQQGIALGCKAIGIAYYQLTKYIEALENWNHSLEVFEKLGDRVGISNIQSNIGAIYKNQGNDSKALEYLFNSLRNAELAGEKFRIASALNNIGSVYQHKKTTYDKALEYYLRALPLSENLEDNDLSGTVAGNIGEIYLDRNNNDSALYYFKKSQHAFSGTVDISYALTNIGKAYAQKNSYDTAAFYHQESYDSALANNSILYMEQALQGIASVYAQKGDYKKSVAAYLKAEDMLKEVNSAYDLKNVYTGLANGYSKLSEIGNAYKYQTLLMNIKDTIYNKEADSKLQRYEFNFEIEKKQGKINLLEKDKILQDLSIRRQRLAKNAFLAGFGLILIIAFILYRNYLNKIKVNKLLDSQKAQIEDLLLNILPAEVAKELQEDGHATPRYYESVSVLFTDFKGFTTIADSLSPQAVVAELNDCFIAFDEIIEKHDLEKIKTIGDAYMCAGGIPVEDPDHPLNIIRASLEIQTYMANKNENRKLMGLAPWELRIGIHIGPVVAGVVGKNKYAYDIWGSTVNIASRMESNGEPGQVNISTATYEMIKDIYDCSYRGKIYAKNIGEIDMYFVKGEKGKAAEQQSNKQDDIHDLSQYIPSSN